MAKLPGMPGDIYFGSPDAPPIDWRKAMADNPERFDDDDDDEPSEAHRAEVIRILGFDPRELDGEAATIRLDD
jgi:hypothetical protein